MFTDRLNMSLLAHMNKHLFFFVLFLNVCLIRNQGERGYSSCHINYGRHEGNEFLYNHTLETLSVSYYGELKQTNCPNTASTLLNDC